MHLYFLSLKKYLADNQRHFMLGLAGLAALSIFMGIIYSINGVSQNVVLVFSLFYLGIFGCVRASQMFSSMKNTNGRISTLMSPASSWDKFAARWTVNVPLTIIALIGAFWLSEETRVLSWPFFNGGDSTEWFSYSSIDVPSPWLPASVITGFLAMQAMFCFGAIAWPKMSALKTVLVLWIFSFLLGSVAGCVDYTLSVGTIEMGRILIRTVVVVNIIITLVLWALCYMRFRESEVVDRLF